MDKKIKVLEIGPGNFGKGGISVIAWNWYSRFDLQNLTVDFASNIYPDAKFIQQIKNNGGKFFHFSKSRNILFNQIKKIIETKKIIKENKYDCVHIHCDKSYIALLFYCSAKCCKSNIIIHSHSTGIDNRSIKKNIIVYLKKFLHKICKIWLPKKNVTYLACSDEAAKWLFPRRIIKDKQYKIIKNGIEVQRFIYNADIRNKFRDQFSLNGKFVIGNIGRFTYQKNHDFLIDVFSEVYKHNKNAVLLLVGNGELESIIKEKVVKLGLDDAVIFYGTTPSANELYQVMDCFVFPSHFEGLGMVVVEAQASGLKTLCADTIPEEAKITDLLEYMSLKDTAENWAKKILNYDNGYERRNMLTEITENGYDISQSAKQLEELYMRLEKIKEIQCPDQY